ncbi:MAG: hypothetical protein JXR48_10340 [Candidatus Delongbacteria bacterium]|nr:hypothetical protein [Candidatus Delongbacteria bacterium]MBN2835354.1 hypothetical protein [Candidatus Delongbacteria bacterium]
MNFIIYKDKQNVNLDTVSSITGKEASDNYKIFFNVGGAPLPVTWTFRDIAEGKMVYNHIMAKYVKNIDRDI